MSGTNPAPRPWLPCQTEWVGPNQAQPQASASSQGLGKRGGAWGVSWLPSLSRGPVQSAVIEIDWMLFFLLQM